MHERSIERALIVESEDVAQISAALPGWRIEAIPLSRANEDGGCICLSSDDKQLALLRFGRGTLLRGTSPRSQIVLLLNDPIYPGARILSRPLTAGVGLLLGPLSHLDLFFPANCALLFVSGSISGLDSNSVPGPGSREFLSLTEDLHHRAMEIWQPLLQGGQETVRSTRRTNENPRNPCEELLRQATRVPNDYGGQPVRHVAVVRACSHIDAHLDESISLHQLCDVAGARPRTLEYGFREFYNVGPMTYLRCMRLYRARRELLSARTADVSVTATARRWRFSHMGQFSRDYRLLFGENPSMTLSRALTCATAAT